MVDFVFLVFVFLLSVYISAYLLYFVFIIKNSRRDYGISRDLIYRPNVSLIICAYNEEKTIANKIKNTLEIEYPRDKLEIIIFDNGSKDRTYDVAKNSIDEGIKLYKLEGENRGKSAGLNVAFKYAKGDIIAISDVDCHLKSDVLIKSMPYFADTCVGSVSGTQILLNPDESPSTQMEKALQSGYQFIRKVESVVDSTIVYSGEFTAFRKNLIEKLDEDIAADDTQVAIRVRERGRRALLLEEVNFYEYSPSNFKARWKQKIRRSAAIVQALFRYRHLMFNRQYGLYGMVTYPWNFFMHVVSPYIFASLLAFSLLLLMFNFGVMVKMLVAIIFMFLVAILIASYSKQKGVSYMFNMLLTFVYSQLVLLIGSLSLMKKNPYKWEPLRDTRRY